jgi:hypothetical protein
MEYVVMNDKVVKDHFNTIERLFNNLDKEKDFSKISDLSKKLKEEIISIKNEIDIFDLYLGNMKED